MEILQHLSKQQLIDMIHQHPKRTQHSFSKMTKEKLLELVLSLDIPFVLDVDNLSKYSQKLLLAEAKQYPSYSKQLHGKNKETLCTFIKNSNHEQREKKIIVLREKLLDCLMKDAPLDWTEQDVCSKLDDWL